MSAMTPSPDSSLAEGIAFMQQSNWSAAVPALSRAVQEEPENARAHSSLGVALCQTGQTSAGISAFQEAVRLQPSDASAHYNLSVALIQAGRDAEAAPALERTLDLNPGHTQARTALDGVVARQPAASPAPVETAATPDLAPVGMSSIGGGMAAMDAPASQPLAMAAAGPALAVADAGGMHYTPPAETFVEPQAPSAGKRIGRGLGWGALYGQWWSLWLMIWDVFIGGARDGDLTAMTVVAAAIGLILIFGFIGGLLGLIIGAANMGPDAAAIVGVVAGLLLLGLEYTVSGSGTIFLNIFFWFFTGRFIGSMIGTKVQQPVNV